VEQRLKAVDRCAVVKDLRVYLVERGRRSRGGRDRVTPPSSSKS
jgi:hypothetical protein